MKRQFALFGRLTRYREAISLRRGHELVVQVESVAGSADVTFRVPVQSLPIGVDVDDVRAEVYVVLTWGDEPPQIEDPVAIVYETTATEVEGSPE